MNFKLLKIMLASPLLMASAGQAVAAGAPPLLFGNTYITAGESATVFGDAKAVSYLVAGASARFAGDIQTGTSVTTGAATIVDGNIKAVTSITLGAETEIGNPSEYEEGQNGKGSACFGTGLTTGAAVVYNDDHTCEPSPVNIGYTQDQLVDAKGFYASLTNGMDSKSEQPIADNTLPSMIDVNSVINPLNILATGEVINDPSNGQNIADTNDGMTYVYNASSLTTGEGVIVELRGDVNWVFNIDNMLSIGAGSKIVIGKDENDNVGTGSVTWNVGGYASVGVDATIVGTVLAAGYVSTGVDSNVVAAASTSDAANTTYCGGLFSVNSYVTIGARGDVASCD